MSDTATAAGVSARIVTITPQQAEQLLKRNTRNRAITMSRVDQYAADIRKGDWHVNGEAIKVSVDGEILDGQHRLMAILEADAPIQTLLITGLLPETQETMDQGRSRSFGDTLKIRGERDYFNLAAAVRIVALFERDGVPVKHTGRPAPTFKELSRVLDRNPELRDSVKLAAKLHRNWIAVSMMAALHYLFTIADQEDANDFLGKLLTGESLESNSPIYVLRERLISEHYDNYAFSPKTKMAFVIRAWNAYRQGETIKRLVWNPGGSNPDKFPHIDGLAAQGAGAGDTD